MEAHVHRARADLRPLSEDDVGAHVARLVELREERRLAQDVRRLLERRARQRAARVAVDAEAAQGLDDALARHRVHDELQVPGNT